MTVPAEFPSEPFSGLAFVAEAPSDEEVRRGRPLCGPSGRVYDVGLRRANIDRKTVLTTNFFDEKAPDNDVGPWLRDPVRVEEARARLREELAQVKPNCIVPMGGPALWAFTRHLKISNFRGAVLEASEVVPGAKLLPTYHPAAIMRQWKLLALFIPDLIKAAYEADRGPEILVPKRTLWIEPTMAEIEWFIMERVYGQNADADPLSVDLETGWGMITCCGLAPSAAEAMCIPFVDTRRANKSYWKTAEEELEAWGWIGNLMADDNIAKLGQNFPYDVYWFVDHGIPVRNYREDTRLMHHALYPELPKGLGSMTATYTDLPSWKHWGWRGQEDKRDA